jgi:hypothetical protein
MLLARHNLYEQQNNDIQNIRLSELQDKMKKGGKCSDPEEALLGQLDSASFSRP